MIKRYKSGKTSGLLTIILGPILVLSIALATANLMSTYKRIHHQKQESIWSIIQLDKETGNALFEAQHFITNSLDNKALKTSYEVLWSRFPITISSMNRDNILTQIDGLTGLIHKTFDHVKSAEQLILNSQNIDKFELNQWIGQLNVMAKDINQQLLQNIASSNSEYSQKTADKIIKTALFLLVLIAIFILYLADLLFRLRKEQKRNLHLLAHDTLTGLASRDLTMRTINSSCKNQIPFALIAFDLNKFKAVNDSFGHHAGDQLLIHLADTFKRTLGKFGLVGRIGGDEFLWVAESCEPRIIKQQYSLFLDELTEPCIIDGKRIYLHLSAGGGIASDNNFHVTPLIERVDQAMYQAKAKQLKEIFWENSLNNQPLTKLAASQTESGRKRGARRDLLEYS